MGLPFAPEPLPALRARVPRMLETLWDADECNVKKVSPGLYRPFVFDFDNGLRLIVARETSRGLRRAWGVPDILHTSAIIPYAGGPVPRILAGLDVRMSPVDRKSGAVAARHAAELTRRTASCLRQLLADTPGAEGRAKLPDKPFTTMEGVPHWFWPVPEREALDCQI